MLRLLSLFLSLGLIWGCAPPQKTATPLPVFNPPPQKAVSAEENPGSLFDPGQADFLFADSRAYRVGDIVLVQISESTKATNKATTSSSRDSSLGIGVDSFFGATGSVLNGRVPVGDDTSVVSATNTNSFDGDGKTTRENSLVTTVAARIVRVLPNSVFEVEGGRQVRVNGETQIIVLRGLIRARDIDADNSILSTKMADANIELYGEGIVADKQRPGWLTRVLDNIWPF